MLISTGLAALVLLVGLAMLAAGLHPPRLTTYLLYMLWLVVMMPGTYSLLHGREDRSAAVAYAILGGFNASVGLSMLQRGVGRAVGVRGLIFQQDSIVSVLFQFCSLSELVNVFSPSIRGLAKIHEKNIIQYWVFHAYMDIVFHCLSCEFQ